MSEPLSDEELEEIELMAATVEEERLCQEILRLRRDFKILSERGNHVSECLVLHFEKEKAEAEVERLRKDWQSQNEILKWSDGERTKLEAESDRNQQEDE